MQMFTSNTAVENNKRIQPKDDTFVLNGKMKQQHLGELSSLKEPNP